LTYLRAIISPQHGATAATWANGHGGRGQRKIVADRRRPALCAVKVELPRVFGDVGLDSGCSFAMQLHVQLGQLHWRRIGR